MYTPVQATKVFEHIAAQIEQQILRGDLQQWGSFADGAGVGGTISRESHRRSRSDEDAGTKGSGGHASRPWHHRHRWNFARPQRFI